MQITYYGGFMVVLFFLFMLVDFIRKKQLKEYFIVAALAIGGAGIALGANSLNLLLLQEYDEHAHSLFHYILLFAILKIQKYI